MSNDDPAGDGVGELAQNDAFDVGRDRGILTERDRMLLLDYPDSDIEPGSHTERRARQDVRKRVYNALLDFTILFETMEERDRALVFGDGSPTGSEIQRDASLHDGMRDAFAFLLRELNPHEQLSEAERVHNSAELMLGEAYRRIGDESGYFVRNASLDVEAEKVPWGNIRRDLEEGNELSVDALRFLLGQDEVDTRAVQDLISEMLEDDETE